MMQYPTAGAVPEPEQVPPPRPVQNAVKLMYAGAAIEVIALVVGLLTKGSYKNALMKAHPGYTTAQLHTAESARAIPLVIGAVIAIALWLWMAWAVRKGQNWARILCAVFFGINTLSLLASAVVVRAAPTLIVGIVIWLIGLAAIVLMFGKEARPYYHQTLA
ncbi:MAG TPA: hypothetical protein VGG25_16300 [Streptosporangiaceae bacterium]|jgi:hypothetical protein